MTRVFTVQVRRNKEQMILVMAIGVSLLFLSFLQRLDFNFSGGMSLVEEKEYIENGEIQRTLSLDLGGGNCKWTQPNDAPQNGELFSTLLVAFPGSGKRAAFMQLEGLTEFKAGDDYHLSPDSLERKYAFVKSNYPLHDGIWSFGKKMNQGEFLDLLSLCYLSDKNS